MLMSHLQQLRPQPGLSSGCELTGNSCALCFALPASCSIPTSLIQLFVFKEWESLDGYGGCKAGYRGGKVTGFEPSGPGFESWL